MHPDAMVTEEDDQEEVEEEEAEEEEVLKPRSRKVHFTQLTPDGALLATVSKENSLQSLA